MVKRAFEKLILEISFLINFWLYFNQNMLSLKKCDEHGWIYKILNYVGLFNKKFSKLFIF